MKKEQSPIKYPAGFSLVEVILATSVFVLLVTALVGGYLYGQESTMLAGNRVQATLLAEEGLEAARNIRDEDFTSLLGGTYGLVTAGNQWNLSGSSDVTGIFNRSLRITDVDSDRKTISCTVSWQQNPSRSGTVTLVTRLTNWQKNVSFGGLCHDYAVEQGYTSGICRQNKTQCEKYEETYLSEGDKYCTDGESSDVCCVSSVVSCNAYAVEKGYAAGICRQNTEQCDKYHEEHFSDGDSYCTDGKSSDVCCVSTVSSCNTYAVEQGHASGTCRQNKTQCEQYEETYLPEGDTYCANGPSADVCCVLK